MTVGKIRQINFPQDSAWKSQRSAGMFFFTAAEKIAGITDLGFDFLFTVTKIVIGNQRDNNALHIAADEFKRFTLVVEIVLILPAHAVFALPLGSLFIVGQADCLFTTPHQMRCQNNATGMTGPLVNIQRGIIIREKRVARITKNRFYKIQVGDQATWRKKPGFHGFLWDLSRKFLEPQWA